MIIPLIMIIVLQSIALVAYHEYSKSLKYDFDLLLKHGEAKFWEIQRIAREIDKR